MPVARGTTLTAANKPDAALTQMEDARAIHQSLHDAGSIGQANVAACDAKMREAMAKARRDQSVAEYFQRALKIEERLIASQPTDLDALYAAADAYSGLGDISARSSKQQRKRSRLCIRLAGLVRACSSAIVKFNWRHSQLAYRHPT